MPLFPWQFDFNSVETISLSFDKDIMVVAIDKWSLFGGGRQLRFDCIFYVTSLIFANKYHFELYFQKSLFTFS
jgi:hypothetical protein